MDDAQNPYALAPGEGEARWGVDGALTTIKASDDLTGGRIAVIEDVAPRGEGTPLHTHAADDETFYVLEGEMTFWLGDAAPITGIAGTFVHIPGGVVHAFRVESETARYLIFTTARHGEFYRAISEPALERVLPPPAPMDMERVEAACERYGVQIVGPSPT